MRFSSAVAPALLATGQLAAAAATAQISRSSAVEARYGKIAPKFFIISMVRLVPHLLAKQVHALVTLC